MVVQVRRVVTGHDAQGRAVVLSDGAASATSMLRLGAEAAVVWTSEGFPISNQGDGDEAIRKVATAHRGGTVFRVIDFHPGVTPRPHRTESIDYAVVMSGEIAMELETGDEVMLSAGDVLVQRGTVHNWINRGSVPCRIAFVLIAAERVRGAGWALAAEG